MVAERAQTEEVTDDTYRQQFIKQWRTRWTALPHEVLFRDDLTMGDLKVYMALSSFCWDKSRECHPSRHLLMDMTSLSDRTVSLAVAHLEAMGWVRCDRGNNRRGSNVYSLTGPCIPRHEPPPDGPQARELSTLDAPPSLGNFLPLTRELSTPELGKKVPPNKKNRNRRIEEKESAPHGAGADAPPAAQDHAPSPPAEKPTTTSAPYVIAEALLTAQNRVPTQALCRQKLKAVCEHVTDAYREHPQKPGTADALACIAYLLTDPYIEGDVGRLTPQFLGSQLGPWLKAGKPARWVDPKTRRGKAPPSQVSPPSGVDPRLVALDPRLERWAAARKEERDRYHEAHKHELGGP